MRKLMLALGAVIIAAATHAASVQWGGAIANGDPDTKMSSGSTAWLLWSATQFSGVPTKLDTDAGTATNGGTIVDTYEITGADITSFTFTATYSVEGAGVDGYYAVLVADGSDSNHASYMYMGNITGTSATSPESNLFFNLDWDDASNYLSMNGYNTEVVPEPTSGLLILLGMAGLALKRKRA